MELQSSTLQLNDKVTPILKELDAKCESLYKTFNAKVQAHMESEWATPAVTQAISKHGLGQVKAVEVVNLANYEAQLLVNEFRVTFAPKLTEYYYDARALIHELRNEFMKDESTLAIKTSAEKERQCDAFMFDANQSYESIKKWQACSDHLGKYIENITYTINRLQQIIDNMDRMQNRQMWIDETSGRQAFERLGQDISPDDLRDQANFEAANRALADLRSEHTETLALGDY